MLGMWMFTVKFFQIFCMLEIFYNIMLGNKLWVWVLEKNIPLTTESGSIFSGSMTKSVLSTISAEAGTLNHQYEGRFMKGHCDGNCWCSGRKKKKKKNLIQKKTNQMKTWINGMLGNKTTKLTIQNINSINSMRKSAKP